MRQARLDLSPERTWHQLPKLSMVHSFPLSPLKRMFDHLKIAFKWTHILNQLFCACPFVILKCGREKRFREQEKGERMGERERVSVSERENKNKKFNR